MSVTVAVDITDPTSDAERLDELTRWLQDDLLELDVDDVVRPSVAPLAPGARAVDVAAAGALLVTLGQSAGVIGKVVAAVTDWLKRNPEPARAVKLSFDGQSIELAAATSGEQEELVRAFIRKVAARSSAASPAAGSDAPESEGRSGPPAGQ